MSWNEKLRQDLVIKDFLCIYKDKVTDQWICECASIDLKNGGGYDNDFDRQQRWHYKLKHKTF